MGKIIEPNKMAMIKMIRENMQVRMKKKKALFIFNNKTIDFNDKDTHPVNLCSEHVFCSYSWRPFYSLGLSNNTRHVYNAILPVQPPDPVMSV